MGLFSICLSRVITASGRGRAWAAVLFATMLLASTEAAIAGDDPSYVTFGVGAFDIFDDQTAAEFDLQLRLNRGLWIFLPQAGVFATSDGALYGHVGFYSDFDLGSRLILSPSISVGAYHDGGGKDLGGVVEFRSAIELAYRFDNKSRVGLQFGHLSNAHIYDSNPGEEFIIVNYSLPISLN